MKRKVYFVSDHTGLTVEAIGKALLSQFPDLDYQTVLVPFVDDLKKVEELARKIALEAPQPVVFSSLVNGELRAALQHSGVRCFDFFETYTAPLEEALGVHSAPRLGKHHGIGDPGSYHNRMHAVHFAVDNDDGTVTRHYGESDLILIGVSRSGKTPSCIYLAMQFGVHAANYPITDDDLQSMRLPPVLTRYQERLFGLTIDPPRLAEIREQRRPRSRYASLRQCEDEVRQCEAMLRRHRIPYLNSTRMSVEEIATRIMMEKELRGRK
ncbi:MAG: kinase/pyrophosphorylase [Gammaproteobacteria bacterium]|nr:kinase/pyrophosphorylase [Gammaproteobacteria bacterium]